MDISGEEKFEKFVKWKYSLGELSIEILISGDWKLNSSVNLYSVQ